MKIVMYTHSDYKWVWPYWKKQSDLYLPNWLGEKLIIVDKDPDMFFYEHDKQFYSEELPYCWRVGAAVGRLDPKEVVLFQHEDMFLYKQPDYYKLGQFARLVEHGYADVIKLIRAEPTLIKSSLHENLYHNPPDMRFAIQPCLIRAGKLMNLMGDAGRGNIWESETRMYTSNVIDPMKSFFCYNGEKKRGSAHYDSDIYPYIATAVVKGKWNFAEYDKELKELGIQ